MHTTVHHLSHFINSSWTRGAATCGGALACDKTIHVATCRKLHSYGQILLRQEALLEANDMGLRHARKIINSEKKDMALDKLRVTRNCWKADSSTERVRTCIRL